MVSKLDFFGICYIGLQLQTNFQVSPYSIDFSVGISFNQEKIWWWNSCKIIMINKGRSWHISPQNATHLGSLLIVTLILIWVCIYFTPLKCVFLHSAKRPSQELEVCEGKVVSDRSDETGSAGILSCLTHFTKWSDCNKTWKRSKGRINWSKNHRIWNQNGPPV